jgi:predicted RNase H-like nuclease (RuvC/YqgF family)
MTTEQLTTEIADLHRQLAEAKAEIATLQTQRDAFQRGFEAQTRQHRQARADLDNLKKQKLPEPGLSDG